MSTSVQKGLIEEAYTAQPSPSYSITVRVRLENKLGTIGDVTSAIGRAGGDVGAIDIVHAAPDHIVRDITIDTASVEHGEEIVNCIQALHGARVVSVSDRTF